jgi:hypothetical protein
VLQLQRRAGNAATAKALHVAAAPAPFTPTAPLTDNVLGHTKVAGRELPDFKVTQAAVGSTTKGKVDIEAIYMAPGLYDMEPDRYGARKKLVTKAMSDLVKEGEQEHADDIWHGHEIVATEAARAVNVLAARGPHKAGGARETLRYWRNELHGVISPKIRITAEASEPPDGASVKVPWMDALSSLHLATLARDEKPKEWHTMRLRAANAKELKEHPMPQGTRLLVVDQGGQIGKHKSEPYIRAAWNALKDRP